jgi:hypothetical protein
MLAQKAIENLSITAISLYLYTMRDFWFRKPRETYRYSRINAWYAVFSVVGLLFFSFFTRLQTAVLADQTASIFEQDLNELALYASTYDPRAASVILSMQRIIQWYENKDFLATYGGDIQNVLQYLSNNPEKFKQLGLQQYAPFIDFITQLSAQKDDIFSLLGKEKVQTYIIALQNTAEKRPNGWFFGSFVKVSLFDAKIVDMKFIDSYVPGIIRPDVVLQAPERSKTFLGDDRTITFLASNKFGFTDIDGKNIKNLYDRTYSDDIRWVVFVQSKLFADLLPGFQELLWEWQFKNASIDLIRWQALPNKKELYFNGVNEFLKTHQKDIVKNIIKHFEKVKDNRYIQTYVVRTSETLKQLLQAEQLQTVFNDKNIYLWDYNSSYNKIDTFIKKTTSIFDSKWVLVDESTYDVIDIAALKPGSYSMRVQYILSIPTTYVSFIEKLTKEFGIWLNSREKHILALYPEWSTRWVVYAPENVDITSVGWPVKTSEIFDTPFSHNAFYVVENTSNNSIKEVSIKFAIQ